jgi:hypothetical protein
MSSTVKTMARILVACGLVSGACTKINEDYCGQDKPRCREGYTCVLERNLCVLSPDGGADGAVDAGLDAEDVADGAVDAGLDAEDVADGAVDAGLDAEDVADGAVDAADSGSTNKAHNLMFTTSTLYSPGLIGGLSGADAICNARAAAAELPGTFVAWLSAPGCTAGACSAEQRLGSARGWVRKDGLPFAASVADIVAGKILYPPILDEWGSQVGTEGVATGTGANGQAKGGNCGNWGSVDGNFMSGLPHSGTEVWTDAGEVPCSGDSVRLYCFGVDHSTPLQLPEADGRVAFLSSNRFSPAGGRDSADRLCRDEAMAANLGGEFVALLATSSEPALSRPVTRRRPMVPPRRRSDCRGGLGSLRWPRPAESSHYCLCRWRSLCVGFGLDGRDRTQSDDHC